MGDRLVFALRRPMLNAATWAYARFRTGRSPRLGLRILTYHAIGTTIDGDVRFLYNLKPVRFEEHVRHLAGHYTDCLVPLGSCASTGDSLSIALTFDDGYRDNLSIAAPLLAARGIPFTVFVCTGEVARRKPGFLSPEDVRELARVPGASIGSHGVRHVRLTECDEHCLREEMSGSKSFLEDLLGMEVDMLSYPHGAVDRRVRDMAEAVGYRVGATSRFDINEPGRDPMLLCRTDIWADDDASNFEKKLRGDWDWNRWRNIDPDSSAKMARDS